MSKFYNDPIFWEVFSYISLAFAAHVVMWYILFRSFMYIMKNANEINRGAIRSHSTHMFGRSKEELFDELGKHREILQLNRLDNLEKKLKD